MEYTLYYQQEYGNTVAVAASDSLLKLLKIEKMSFRHSTGFSYIVKTSTRDGRDAFSYGAGCLSCNSHDEYMRFCEAVDGGKYFKSYDYRQRVRDRGIWSV